MVLYKKYNMLYFLFERGELVLKNDKELQTEKSRSNQRAKRRKTNLVLNSLIIVVLLLIVIVSVNIFGKDDKTEAENKSEETVASTADVESETDKQSEKANKEEKDSSEEDENEADEDEKDEQEQSDQDVIEEGAAINDEQIVTDGGSDPNASKTIVNPSWQPVETSQAEPAQDYKKGSVDWNEQIQAISYATGFNEGKGDELHRLENNGPKKSAATVFIKETNKKYRVYLEWTDGQGWKPALVEELSN